MTRDTVRFGIILLLTFMVGFILADVCSRNSEIVDDETNKSTDDDPRLRVCGSLVAQLGDKVCAEHFPYKYDEDGEFRIANKNIFDKIKFLGAGTICCKCGCTKRAFKKFFCPGTPDDYIPTENPEVDEVVFE